MFLQEGVRKIFETTEIGEDWYNTSDTVGLGYKLASGLVKAMGGNIMVSDSSFKGITVEFSIPAKQVIPKHYHSGEINSTEAVGLQEE